MKLIGVIAVLVLLATSCQKDVVQPNRPISAPTYRSADTPVTNVGDEDGTIDDTTPAITDPNDANRTNKNPKPRQ
jgi:hypothetical protein